MVEFLPAPVDLDLRLVRSFVTVAEQQHFARAAALLGLPQPTVSRHVRRLEECVGARLLERTPQGSRLTEAGQVFAPRARALVRAAGQAVVLARAAARPDVLIVGWTTDLIVTAALRAVRLRYPHADVRAVHLDWDGPHEALLAGRVDAAVARLPLSPDGLDITVLYDEPRMLLVATDHRLADRESVTVDDIADEPVPRSLDTAWNAFWRLDPRPDGTAAPDGPLVDAIEDKFELIAAGQAVAIVPASAHLGTLRADLTAIPLRGVEPSHVVLATRAGERSRLSAAFHTAAREHLTPPAPVLAPHPVS